MQQSTENCADKGQERIIHSNLSHSDYEIIAGAW